MPGRFVRDRLSRFYARDGPLADQGRANEARYLCAHGKYTTLEGGCLHQAFTAGRVAPIVSSLILRSKGKTSCLTTILICSSQAKS